MYNMIACTLGIQVSGCKHTSCWQNSYSNESWTTPPPFGADMDCPRQIHVHENSWFKVSELNRGAAQSLSFVPPGM